MSIRDRRIQYETAGLEIDDLHPDPIAQFNRWYTQAEEAKVAEPNAMTVSTVGLDGMPDSRIVLAREVEQSGFVFYTNYSSAKSKQLNENSSASAVFAWLDLHRQVRLRGKVHATSPQQSDAYFASRPRESQIGAWASAQSEKLSSRADLEARVRELTQTYSGQEIPRPAFWGGWCIVPMSMEFWQGRPSRLHDRFSYVHQAQGWSITRLSP